jgi:outer membrane protein OmpA-like peptidoglycan-associated protein
MMMAPESAQRSGGVAHAKAARLRTTLAVGLLVLGAGDLAAIDTLLLPRYLALRGSVAPPALGLPAPPPTEPVAEPPALDSAATIDQAAETCPEPAQPIAEEAEPARQEVEPEVASPPWPHLLFNRSSASLSRDAQETLDELAGHLKQHADLHVVLGGHTDDLGPDDVNRSLARIRASRARKWLLDRGVDPVQVEIHAFGSSKPLTPGRTAEARAQNRRVEISLRERTP